MRENILERVKIDLKLLKNINGYYLNVLDENIHQGIKSPDMINQRPAISFDLIPTTYELKGESKDIRSGVSILFIVIHFASHELSETAEKIIKDMDVFIDWRFPSDPNKSLNLFRSRVPVNVGNDISVLEWHQELISKDLDMVNGIGSTYHQVRIKHEDYQGTINLEVLTDEEGNALLDENGNPLIQE